MTSQPRIEYIDARRVLLDALTALQAQLDAVVLVGAQAVYLRTAGRLPTYQPFTTDADLVLSPDLLAARPPLGDVMIAAGFVLPGEPGIWEARFHREGIADEIVVPVDLIVPMQVASGSGRRGARLGGDHGKHTAPQERRARRCAGRQRRHRDHISRNVGHSLGCRTRRRRSRAAGLQLFKLGERLAKPERLEAKDAGDIYRLFDVLSPDEMADRFQLLLADERSATTSVAAIEYGKQLFQSRGSPGVSLGATALAGTMPEATVVAVLTNYWNELASLLE